MMNLKFIDALKSSLLLVALAMTSCALQPESKEVFRQIASKDSGVTFVNQLTSTPDLNILNYMYFNNGGGVAAEDFNGDGLIDIYFTSNQEQNRLYLNLGNFKFLDVTETAGVTGPSGGWTTGVTTADVNADGRLDIYVSMLGNYQGIVGANRLFINQGNDEEGVPLFEEQTSQYGLDLVGFATQAAFFDFDLDGDLDMYQLNHSVHSNGTFVEKRLAEEGHPLAGDKLMRNDDGTFIDVTAESGISSNQLGFGLGLAISDLNNDGLPDIYVGNDFHEDDYLYINNGDGTFTESLREQITMTSRYAMGNDVADLNNDGFMDVISVDMLPSDYQVLKASQTEDNFQIFEMKRSLGYGYQYSRNTLQLNNGNNTFSEIGVFANIAATDWSWSPLIADFNLDGTQEVFITNGIVKRPNDLDYLNFVIADQERALRSQGGITRMEDMQIIDLMPELKISNVLFAQAEDLQFHDSAKEWGLDQPSYSSGAAYADFDNDGDLDLVVNNTNHEAFLFENTTVSQTNDSISFLVFDLKYKKENLFGVGSKVEVRLGDGKILAREVFATRGFQSSVGHRVHIGIPKDSNISSLRITWPDQEVQEVIDYSLNELNTIDYQPNTTPSLPAQPKTLFAQVAELPGLDYMHEENTSFNEFAREALMLQSQATEGPAVAVADIDGNGLEDIYLGGAKNQSGVLYLQQESGFLSVQEELFEQDKKQEDVKAEWQDVDGNGWLDLIVLTGGNEFYRNEAERIPKVYLNEEGTLTRQEIAFNGIALTGGALAFSDLDGDGFVDAFVGSRCEPWQYGIGSNSYFLRNDGNGNLMLDVAISEKLNDLGMVRDAKWADMNQDGYKDLVVVGDWFPITIFLSNGSTLEKVDSREFGLEQSHGFWSALELSDLNGDGRPDLVLGNLGTNTKLKASGEYPLEMLVDDFDRNGKVEQLVYTHREGAYKLFPTKDELAGQLIEIKKRFTNYQSFARATQEEIIPAKWREGAVRKRVHELESATYLSTTEGKWQKVSLPIEAQFSPIYALKLLDVNGDGHLDLLTGGNLFAVTTQIGKYDSSFGNVFLNDGQGIFRHVSASRSGLSVIGEVRHIETLDVQGKEHLLFIRNNMPMAIYNQQ